MASNRPFLLALTALFMLLPPVRADEIVMKGRSGSKLSEIKISEVTYEGMKWANKLGGRGLVRFNKIASATFDNSPWEYERGRDAFKEGRYEDAIKDFRKAIKGSSDDIWVDQYCLWRIARSQLRLGQAKAAGKTLQALLDWGHKKTRYLPDALITRGRIALNSGDKAGALKAFKKLSALAQVEDSRLDRKFYFLGQAWLAKTYLVSNQSAKALELFRDLRGTTQTSYPSVYLLSTIGEGQALTRTKEYNLARPLFIEAIEKAGQNRAVLAQAYNGIGETYYSAGTNEDLHIALKAFLKVILLFDAQTAELPKALWHASKCFGKLRGSSKAWAARSRELRRELRERFPQSSWARKP